MNILGKNTSADTDQQTSISKEPLRFRLYYRLMDFTLVIYLLALLLAFTVMLTGTDPETLPAAIRVGIGLLVTFVTMLLLPFLIVYSRMRDEYAELLWKRTVAQLTVLAILVPPIVSGLIWFLYLVVLDGNPEANWGGNRPDWLLDPIYDEEVRLYTVLDVWRYYTFGFVLLFQFNRWRDSRAASE